jgi:hypothetical protein
VNQDEKANFKRLFCKLFEYPLEKFERRALLKVLYVHAAILACLTLPFTTVPWDADLQILKALGEETERANAMVDAADVKKEYRRLSRFGFIRKTLKVRISGRKLAGLIAEVWQQERRASRVQV